MKAEELAESRGVVGETSRLHQQPVPVEYARPFRDRPGGGGQTELSNIRHFSESDRWPVFGLSRGEGCKERGDRFPPVRFGKKSQSGEPEAQITLSDRLYYGGQPTMTSQPALTDIRWESYGLMTTSLGLAGSTKFRPRPWFSLSVAGTSRSAI
jgi:hypothetical protein